MSQSIPFRLKFLQGLTSVLQGVTPANGFFHDLSDKTFRGRLTFGDSDPIPLVSIIEPPLMPPNSPTPLGAGVRKVSWDLIVQGFADDDIANPTDPAHMLLAEVKIVLAQEVAKLQGTPCPANEIMFGVPRKRIVSFESEIGFVRPSDDISSKAYFWLPLHIVVLENWLNPYD
jgi:hypothetical protein